MPLFVRSPLPCLCSFVLALIFTESSHKRCPLDTVKLASCPPKARESLASLGSLVLLKLTLQVGLGLLGTPEGQPGQHSDPLSLLASVLVMLWLG